MSVDSRATTGRPSRSASATSGAMARCSGLIMPRGYVRAGVCQNAVRAVVWPDGRLDPRLRPAPHAPPPVPGLEELRLHLADEALADLARGAARDRRPGRADDLLGVRLGGGLAIGRYLREHPEVVAGKRVFDLASGSGCARSPRCARAPSPLRPPTSTPSRCPRSASTRAPTTAASRRSGATCSTTTRPTPTSSSPATAGTRRRSPSACCRGSCGRTRRGSTSSSATRAAATCRPTTSMELAAYDVRTTTELEDLERKQGRVYRLAERA